jgi:hypothetical protein
LKTQVGIEYVEWLIEEINKINRLKLADIEWTLKGEVVPVSREVAEAFKFTGLNNKDFISTGFYQHDPNDLGFYLTSDEQLVKKQHPLQSLLDNMYDLDPEMADIANAACDELLKEEHEANIASNKALGPLLSHNVGKKVTL